MVALPASGLLLLVTVNSSSPYAAVAALSLAYAIVELCEAPFWGSDHVRGPRRHDVRHGHPEYRWQWRRIDRNSYRRLPLGRVTGRRRSSLARVSPWSGPSPGWVSMPRNDLSRRTQSRPDADAWTADRGAVRAALGRRWPSTRACDAVFMGLARRRRVPAARLFFTLYAPHAGPLR